MTEIVDRRIPVRIRASKLLSITIGAGIVDRLPELYDFAPYSAIILIDDAETHRRYAGRVTGALKASGKKVLTFTVPIGESSKSLEEVERIYKFLVDHAVDRRALFCLLGGGVVGDLAGYVAATYLRGVDYIQLPTTFLAQVDSSIGGKVGVNFAGKKNLIGSFYQARAVFSDVSLLESLPPSEMRNGIAEIIKYGLAMDRVLYRQLEDKGSVEFTPAELVEIIVRCCRLKVRVVQADETERTGERAILNFGHTVGHAIEASSGLTDRHGEAIAIGMAAAARISERMGMLGRESVDEIEGLLARFGLPTRYQNLSSTDIIEAIRFDKKAVGSQVRWVLLEGIGRGVPNCIVDEKIVREVLEEMRR